MKTYRPHPRTAVILDLAWEHVSGVPYPVSLRWLFYRLYQEGIYKDKDEYHSLFGPKLSKARKGFYKDWRPWTLIDDTRGAYNLPSGHANKEAWLEKIRGLGCELDPWITQEGYGIIAFEAQAMYHQFAYHAPPIFSLWPFRGDAGIEFKWRLAQHITDAAETYAKPVTLFYFGDLDPKGEDIPQNALQDVRAWAPIDFEFVRGGLNPGHETRFEILENPDKPGEYQWEALTDEAAKTLIEEALGGFYDEERREAIREEERQATEAFQDAIDQLEL